MIYDIIYYNDKRWYIQYAPTNRFWTGHILLQPIIVHQPSSVVWIAYFVGRTHPHIARVYIHHQTEEVEGSNLRQGFDPKVGTRWAPTTPQPWPLRDADGKMMALMSHFVTYPINHQWTCSFPWSSSHSPLLTICFQCQLCDKITFFALSEYSICQNLVEQNLSSCVWLHCMLGQG